MAYYTALLTALVVEDASIHESRRERRACTAGAGARSSTRYSSRKAQRTICETQRHPPQFVILNLSHLSQTGSRWWRASRRSREGAARMSGEGTTRGVPLSSDLASDTVFAGRQRRSEMANPLSLASPPRVALTHRPSEANQVISYKSGLSLRFVLVDLIPALLYSCHDDDDDYVGESVKACERFLVVCVLLS